MSTSKVVVTGQYVEAFDAETQSLTATMWIRRGSKSHHVTVEYTHEPHDFACWVAGIEDQDERLEWLDQAAIEATTDLWRWLWREWEVTLN